MTSRPRRRPSRLAAATAAAAAAAASAVPAVTLGQTTVNAASLALRSSGAAATEGSAATGWTLSTDGYEGTYVTVASPAAVTLTATAAGTAAGSALPDLTLSIANSSKSFAVAAGANGTYTYTTPIMAAGTYLIRAQLDDSAAGSASTPSLTLASLGVGGSGVAVANAASSANATAAAQTYAAHYRAGAATVSLLYPGGAAVGAGTAAHVQLARNAFNFDCSVPGQSPSYQPPAWLNYSTATGAYAPPTAGTVQAQYQSHLEQNFNGIVPENAGKWQNDEYTQGSVNLTILNAQTQFAQANGLGLRMHNLIWASQQPAFVNSLFTTINSASSTAAQVAAAKQSLSNAITSRINYYVSGSVPTYGGGSMPRGATYQELDVLNEQVHGQSSADPYLTAYGNAGAAQIYGQVASAVSAAGGTARLYTNEYNVLNNSVNPATNAADPYANWYLNAVTALNAAGSGRVVTGVGTQLYTTYAAAGTPSLTAAGVQAALSNLSVAGLPISLTEFGASTYGTTPTPAAYAADLTTALTLIYGDPQATTFGYWGGLGGSIDANATTSLYDANWNLTAAGSAYQSFMQGVDTDLDLTTGTDGALAFTGTYGTYALTVDGQAYQFTLAPGATAVTVTLVPEPAATAALLLGAAGLLGRGRKRTNR